MVPSTRLALVIVVLVAIAISASRRSPVRAHAERTPTVAPRSIEPTRWLPRPTGDTRIVARCDGALFALSGAKRVELSARNELAVADDPDVAAWSVAHAVGDRWLFVAADGAVFRATTFTGALVRTQRLAARVERATEIDGSLTMVDANGNLYALDGDRLVRELGPPEARVLVGVRSRRGVSFAMTSERRWLARSAPRARWVSTESTNEILVAFHAGRRGVYECAGDFENPCSLDPSCLDPEPTPPALAHSDLARIDDAMRSATPAGAHVTEPQIELVFAPSDAPITAQARVVCDTDSLCVQWQGGVERCVRTPGLEVASHRPERGGVYRGRCAIVPLVAVSAPASLARAVTVCADGEPRWTKLPEDTAGVWFFDAQHAVTWNDSRTQFHRTRDGGATWARHTITNVATRGSPRAVRLAEPSSGVLFDDGFWLSAREVDVSQSSAIAPQEAPQR